MYERLDKLREEVKRCEKRRDEANERLKAAQAKLKEAEASQILSDVGALKLTPEEVARLLQLAASGELSLPATEKNSTMTETEEYVDGSIEVAEDEDEDLDELMEDFKDED